jgi:hypothetical protein
MSKCGCDMLKELGIVIIKEEAPTAPPTSNDHIKEAGFTTISSKNVPAVNQIGTPTLRNPDA